MAELNQREIFELIRSSSNVAVLGASNRPGRPARYVPEYLMRHGFRVFPVNPRLAGEELWGSAVASSLSEIQEPIDIVNVFRRSQDVPDHLDDILALDPKPRAVWLQLGIRNDQVALTLDSNGIGIVQDRCLLVEHQALGRG